MTPITQKDLEGLLLRLNHVAGTPITPYTKMSGGKHRVNVGNYHLDMACGGVNVVQMNNEGCGIRTITQGCETKRNCYNQLYMYIRGIEDCVCGNIKLNKTINQIVG